MTLQFVACDFTEEDDDDQKTSTTTKKNSVELYVTTDMSSIINPDSPEWSKANKTALFDGITWEPGYHAIAYVMVKNTSNKSASFFISPKDGIKLNDLADVLDVYTSSIGEVGIKNVSDISGSTVQIAKPIGTLSEIAEDDLTLFSGTLAPNETKFFQLMLVMQTTAGNEYAEYDDFGGKFYIECEYHSFAGSATSDGDIITYPESNSGLIETVPNETYPIETDPIETDPPEAVPDNVEQKNYNDEFYLSIVPDTNPEKYFWVDEPQGDMMSEVVYHRQEKVYNWLGVTIKEKSAGSFSTYIDPFKTAVANKDGSVDTLITHVNSGVSGLISSTISGTDSEMYLRDLNSLPGVDLEQDYWNKDIMDTLSIHGKSYLGYSDFNIPYTYVIAFNKTMLNQLALDGYGVDEMYELVYTGNWTLDSFLNLAQLGFQEKGDKDIYGLTGQQWVPWIGFLHASGINYVEQDETGTYKISIMNDANKEKTANLVDKLKNFSSSGYAQLTFPTAGVSGVPSPEAKFTNNRSLMSLVATYGLVDYLDSDVSFGVLPYPMYDRDQYDPNSESLGYRSLQWGGYLAVPSYLRNEQMVGETLELLALYSEPVRTTFCEKLLGRQVADSKEDSQMLDIVWSSLCADFGQTYNDEAGMLYTLPYVTWSGEGGQELCSYVASKEPSGNKRISQFVKRVDKYGSAQ